MTSETSSVPAEPTLGIPGLRYQDLRTPAGLPAVYAAFERFFADQADEDTRQRFHRYRDTQGEGLAPEEISETLVKAAPHVGRFLAKLFGLEAAYGVLHTRAEQASAIFRFKCDFVKKRVVKRKRTELDGLDTAARQGLDEAARKLLSLAEPARGSVWNDEQEVSETVLALLAREDLFAKSASAGGVSSTPDDLSLALDFARKLAAEATLEAGALVQDPMTDEAAVKVYAHALEVLERWCLLRMHDSGYDHHWVSLRLPKPVEHQHLVHIRRPDAKLPEMLTGPENKLRARDGFALTDRRPPETEIRDEADYCIYCHERSKDSCSKGLKDKSGTYKANPLGIVLTGCPLEEKISEMNFLQAQGQSLAALAVTMIDNPMCPGTGHRICNDCMKACIYQKQTPVNIPAIETAVLTDVLNLPWGFELYDLLTRFNPLNVKRPYALPYNGRNVLVVGLGPAGYTLSQHLLNEGFGVVGIDGLKLEGMDPAVYQTPIERWKDRYAELDQRILLGFGGVSEYGITVRWDKNFLDLVYMTLSRRTNFRSYGGIRFGGTLELGDAWKLGFHHVAIAAGAGKPTLVDMPNGLARGIRQASDFLMALQLTGALKKDSLTNLPVRLPGLVIGGGLTGIDTATEMRAYYVVQCEKIWERFHAMAAQQGRETLLASFDAEERAVLEEALAHGAALRAERKQAKEAGRAPDFNALLDSWGGVTLAYRRGLEESPAYRLNHEEVEKCFEEGVRFVERVSPKEATVDAHGAVKSVVFDRMLLKDGKLVASGETVELPARTVCIAAGTSPNVTYERECPKSFEMDPKTRAFKSFRAERNAAGDIQLTADSRGFFTSYLHDEHTVSFYGDNHPTYAGSVVKAMASAKDGFPHVVALFQPYLATLKPAQQDLRDAAWKALTDTLDDQLLAHVVGVERLTPTIVEVTVRAPLAARKFQPGQFYRLQNFERLAPVHHGTRLQMEGLALTGASTDPEAGLLRTIVLEMGASSRLCAALKPGEPVVLMGPTGAPTELPHNETVLLAGGGLGNAVLFSIGRALRANGCKVLYFAGYRKPEDIYKQDEIEAAADQIIWATDVAPAPVPRRPQDRSFVGNIVKAMVAFAQGELGDVVVPLQDCQRLIVIGSDRMMAAVKSARHGVLAPWLKADHVAIGSINSPMQCMMKEICAQCLQRHVDPVTGKVSVVFSCFNQDQELDRVDFEFLQTRLRAASMQEKLSNRWLDHLLTLESVNRV